MDVLHVLETKHAGQQRIGQLSTRDSTLTQATFKMGLGKGTRHTNIYSMQKLQWTAPQPSHRRTAAATKIRELFHCVVSLLRTTLVPCGKRVATCLSNGYPKHPFSVVKQPKQSIVVDSLNWKWFVTLTRTCRST